MTPAFDEIAKLTYNNTLEKFQIYASITLNYLHFLRNVLSKIPKDQDGDGKANTY